MKARALVAWNVRRIRVNRGISQEKLAYEAGIDRSYMGRLERQSKNPAPEHTSAPTSLHSATNQQIY